MHCISRAKFSLNCNTIIRHFVTDEFSSSPPPDAREASGFSNWCIVFKSNINYEKKRKKEKPPKYYLKNLSQGIFGFHRISPISTSPQTQTRQILGITLDNVIITAAIFNKDFQQRHYINAIRLE